MRDLIARAERAGASGITARVATDLEALAFWQSQGFTITDIVAGGQKRNRQIARIWLPLALPLFPDDDAR